MNLSPDGNRLHRGYIYIKCLNHPRTNKDGFVKRAVLELERKLNRYLEPNEDIHHINNIRDDDSPNNLIVLSHSEHARLHGKLQHKLPKSVKGRPFYGNQYSKSH